MSFGARFLRHSGRFPASLEGEPWGEREAVLDLPGGPYRCGGLSAAQEEAVRVTFPGSVLPGSPLPASPPPPPAPGPPATGPAVQFRLLRCAAEDFLSVDTHGWDYGLDFEWSPAAVRLAGLGLVARLELRPHLAAAPWTAGGGGPRLAGG